MPGPDSPYAGWSADALIERVQALEKELKETQARLPDKRPVPGTPPATSRPAKKARTFDWSRHSTRFIALKFAYLGKRYNGFEHHANNTTPLPTVEETVWKALTKACLISPQGDVTGKHNAIDWEGCEYSKCGRTDRGVSAFGQVIGLRVRSSRPLEREAAPAVEAAAQFDDVRDEMPYLQILNSVLPPDIRALAWCPSPPEGFSARFSCRERRYRYFFTQPAFTPTPGKSGLAKSLTGSSGGHPRREAWLDIERMRAAAKRYEGMHDFRNFCKVDGSKQISDFRRRIYHADVRELGPSEQPGSFLADPMFAEFDAEPPTAASSLAVPRTYCFELHGSAFLWHQVRHMVAVLFLVGQGLEEPSVIDRLLDASSCPAKPTYEMAEDTPLVLWDCIFPHPDDDSRADALRWVRVGEEGSSRGGSKTAVAQSRGRFGIGGLVNETWRMWRERRMDEIVAGALLNLVGGLGGSAAQEAARQGTVLTGRSDSQRVFLGGNEAVYRGQYVPLMDRRRSKAPEETNREWAAKHGAPGARKPKDAAFVETRRDHEE